MTDPRHAGEMPVPRHHPSVETLALFAAGNMQAGFDVVVSAHLQACSTCRAEMARLEQMGGHLLSELEPLKMEDSALALTLARLEAPDAGSPQRRELRDILANARRRWVAPGVWTARLDTPHSLNDRIYLLRVAPGARTARHTHSGAEFTQVLEGALDDGGTIYRAGDFVELGTENTHRPMVHGDEACLCLFATEGRLIATDFIGRVAFAIANV